MASTYSKLKIELIGTGDQAGQWGTTTNNNLGSSSAGVYRGLEQAIVGMATISSGFVANSYTLPYTNSNDDQEFRCLVLNITASLSNPSDLIVPAIQKPYIVINSSGQTVTVKVSGQTGVAVPNGAKILLYNTGTDVGTAVTYLTELKLGGNLTMPSAGSINDSNGNELIKFPSAVASAVNELTISNAATGSAPTLSATGGDTNIGITLTPKGTGTFLVTGNTTLGDATTDTITLTGTIQPGVVISGSSSGDALRITQTGAGNALLVEDDTNPDSTPFVVNASGSVGIGTSSPQQKLHVVSTSSGAATYPLMIENAASATGTESRIFFVQGGNSTRGAYIGGRNEDASGAPTSMVFGVSSAFAAPTERMRLDSSGNLGLGVTPSAWGTAGSSRSIQVQLAALSFRGAGSTDSALTHGAYYNGTNWIYQDTNVGAARYQMTGANGGSTHSWSVAAGGTANTAITFTQAMTLDASGRLQIGTTSAQASSTVSVKGGSVRVYNGQPATVTYDLGPAAASGDYAYLSWNNTSGSQELKLYGDAGIISFYANAAERARITSGGDLLVGTTTNVAGARLKSKVAAGTFGLEVTDESQSDFIVVPLSGAVCRVGPSAGAMAFYSANTERARITSGGDLGVGTTSPSTRIHAVATGGAIRMQDSAGTAKYVQMRSDSTSSHLEHIGGPGDALKINNQAAGTIEFLTSNTERARITSGGEVYIAGTTDQGAYNLQVNGTGVWGAGAYVNGSDERLKDNIQTLNDGLAVVSQLRPVTFQYKPEHSKDQSVQPGFIAQELQQAMDGKAYLDGVVQSGPEYLNVAYQNLIPILTKAIQEQQAIITSLTARVAALEGTQP